MTPDPLDLDAIERLVGGEWNMDGDIADLIAEVRSLRAEVARLRAVGQDDIAAWAEYVTGKKWAPVAEEQS